MMSTQISSKRHLSRTIRMMIAAVAVVPMIALQASAQQSEAADVSSLIHSAKFEVVSIHPDDPDGHRMRIGMGPDARFVAEGVTIKRLVCMAYGIQDFQLEGAPNWFTAQRFSIHAKSESEVEEQFPRLTDDQKMMVGKQMVQDMLADRFKLSLRQESKEVPILGIVADKNGPKLHEAKPGDTYPNGLKDGDGTGHAGMMRFNGTHLTAQGMKLDNLASFLSGQLNEIVENKTGLNGNYDFTLEWSPEADRPEGPARVSESENASADGNSGASIFTAIKEQLGLRLESQKGAVPVYVVIKAEKPSEN